MVGKLADIGGPVQELAIGLRIGKAVSRPVGRDEPHPQIDEDGIADFTPMFNAGFCKILAIRKFDASKQYLWPIPSKEILINENLEPQNPGY